MIEPNAFINGDCMDYLKDYPDNYFDLAIVDPPYGDVTQGGYMTNKISSRIKPNVSRTKYHLALWNQQKPQKKYFEELFRVSKHQIIWGGNYLTTLIQRDSQCWLAWDKDKPEGVGYADVELAYTSFNKAAKLFRFTWDGMRQGDMKNKEYKIHPTQKPVALYKWCISNFAKPGDIILDTHAGSASCLIAAHETGHKYVGFEIDPTYYHMAKERLDQAENQQNIFDYLVEEPGETQAAICEIWKEGQKR